LVNNILANKKLSTSKMNEHTHTPTPTAAILLWLLLRAVAFFNAPNNRPLDGLGCYMCDTIRVFPTFNANQYKKQQQQQRTNCSLSETCCRDDFRLNLDRMLYTQT
jgi:hypothetical protein